VADQVLGFASQLDFVVNIYSSTHVLNFDLYKIQLVLDLLQHKVTESL
jgi:hypothetical protein